MTLEVRYVPMVDEGDKDYPKIMRVIYNNGTAVAYEPTNIKEAEAADPSCIEPYFNLVRDYFRNVADYLDIQDKTSDEITEKMIDVAYFCLRYHEQNPFSHVTEMPGA